ncbi:hypothetical protein [Arthrobacter sp. MAHUQ-56]
MNSTPAIETTILGTSIQEATVTVSTETGPAAIKAATASLAHHAKTNALANSTSYREDRKNDDGTYTIRFF